MVLYGEKARIGLILPHEDYTTEYEFNKAAPEGVAFYATRIKLESVTRENLLKMSDEVEIAIERLPPKIDLIIYHCTSGTFVLGLEWEKKLLNKIENETGVKAISTMQSVVEALKQLKLSTISLMTPYTKDLNKMEINYLANFNIKVVKDVGLSITNTEEMCALEHSELSEAAEKADSERSKGLFISCTGLKLMGLINELEKKLNKPVVCSNSATLWNALKKCNAPLKEVKGYGEALFATK